MSKRVFNKVYEYFQKQGYNKAGYEDILTQYGKHLGCAPIRKPQYLYDLAVLASNDWEGFTYWCKSRIKPKTPFRRIRRFLHKNYKVKNFEMFEVLQDFGRTVLEMEIPNNLKEKPAEDRFKIYNAICEKIKPNYTSFQKYMEQYDGRFKEANDGIKS